MLRRLAILALIAALAVVPAVASAALIGRESDDPTGDSAGGPGTDLTHAAWLFDADAGRWVVSATFSVKPSDSDYGIVNAVLRDSSAAGCGGVVFGTLRGSGLGTTATGGAGSDADGPQPDGSTGPSYVTASNTKSDDGRTTVLDMTHARLAGRSAGCVQVTISHNGALDAIDLPLATGTTVTPTPTPSSTGVPAPTPTPVAGSGPQSVRLVSSRTLRFKRSATSIGLVGLAQGIQGRVRVARPRGATLATATYHAHGSIPLTLKLKLTAAGGRYLVRHPRSTAKLTLRTTLGSRVATRSYSVRLLTT